jgi:hypothetical protein
MTSPTSAAARPGRSRQLGERAWVIVCLVAVLAACGNQTPTGSPATASGATTPSGPASASPAASPTPVVTPAPTPVPTPQYSNPADAELSALIPERVAGATVHVPPVEEFAITPGDIGEAYGELGLRFVALQVAYVENPRLSLYAMRVSAPAVTTRDLEPYLETAGRYVGIAGLVREPWKLRRIAGRVTWVRPEDNATAAGTMIYTWAAEQYVFLLIGVDDDLNRALFRELPGEAAPARSADPSGSPSASAGS